MESVFYMMKDGFFGAASLQWEVIQQNMSSVSSQQSIVWCKFKTIKWLNAFVFIFDITASYNIS